MAEGSSGLPDVEILESIDSRVAWDRPNIDANARANRQVLSTKHQGLSTKY